MNMNIRFRNDSDRIRIQGSKTDAEMDVGFTNSSPTLPVRAIDQSGELRTNFQNMQVVTERSAVTSYQELANKPSINEHVLRSGENTLDELGIGLARNTAIDRLF